ncbi:MAG: ATP-binding cassette domain-containing protein [Candidatus Bathyarchaeia archaeon]
MSRTEESELLIHADCLTHIYPDGTKGIHCMYLRVYAHEIVCLCGPNGSGKSTLLEHLNGLLLPTDGILKVFGKRIDAQNLRELRKEVGLVFQDAESQLFSPTILDDVMFGPLNLGLSREEARKRALWALETVGFKEYEKVPHYLSGGEKKLVAIAGVLAMRPRIIALDEPTADLDSRNSRRIEELVVKARDELGMSVVVATHDLDLAARIADRICIVKDGSIVAEGSPAEVFSNKELMESAGLDVPTSIRLYNMIYHEGGWGGPLKPPLKMEELAERIRRDIKMEALLRTGKEDRRTG